MLVAVLSLSRYLVNCGQDFRIDNLKFARSFCHIAHKHALFVLDFIY